MCRLAVCSSLCFLLAQAGVLPAQSPTVETPDVYAYQPMGGRMSWSQRLIYQRAAHCAQQRQIRIESRKWLGHSALRPNVGSSVFAANLNRGLGYPWLSYDTPAWHRTYRH